MRRLVQPVEAERTRIMQAGYRGHFVGGRSNRVAVVMHLPETTKPFTTNRLAFGYPHGEGGQPLGSDVEPLGSCGYLCRVLAHCVAG